MIVINGVSAVSGGALTVLKAFIDSFDGEAICFCAVDPSMLPKKKYVKYICVGHQRGLSRLFWDLFKFNATLKRLNIDLSTCYSFNNMAPFFRSYSPVNQIVFYHQAIPLSEFKFSIFLPAGLRIFFYKHVYPFLVRAYDSGNVRYIVQAEWIKQALSSRCHIATSRISIEKPSFNWPVPVRVALDWYDRVDYIYPADDYQYKNHNLIIKVVEYISSSEGSELQNVTIGLTLDQNSWVFDVVNKKELARYFVFLGGQQRENILGAFAHGCGLVFPSLVETVGLPLLEALRYESTILVSDRPYSREVLGKASNCIFIDPDDIEKWASALSNVNRRRLNEYR